MTTADKVIAHLQSRPELELQPEKNGRYRLNSPVRPGSNSHAFTLTINDGEHGAFYDHNPQGGPESGTLYDLARQLGIEPPKPDAAPPAARPSYSTLAEYAQAHGVNEAVFTGAGWQEVTKKNRPALSLPTQTGPKYRFLDGKKPKYQKCYQ